jgi:hypothetical protein
MLARTNRQLALVALTAAALALGTPAGAQEKPRTETSTAVCTLEFQRADNMWNAIGMPSPSLGTERITLQPGQAKIFLTDWKYEKKINDGTTYYGPHLRVGRNPSGRPIKMMVKSNPLLGGNWVTIYPTQQAMYRADLMQVFCPEA